MYTDEYEQRGFPIKKIITRLAIVILIIFLLIWLVQKFIIPAASKMQKSRQEKQATEVVNDSLNMMKQAALEYYTIENVPEEKEKLTIKEMISKKILSELTGNNKKYLDMEESYILLTKEAEQYVLTVKAKAHSIEDETILYLNSYNYCKNFLCEKDDSKELSTEEDNVDVPSTGIYEDEIIEVPNTGIYEDE